MSKDWGWFVFCAGFAVLDIAGKHYAFAVINLALATYWGLRAYRGEA